MKKVNQFLLVSLIPILLLLLVNSCKKEESRPNIILVMADDQGWGDMAYYNHPVLKTPNFDAMAEEGLRFDQFYASSPVCSPTRGSVLTGRHPNRFGCFSWGHSLRPQEVTIAEVLKEAGYVTGHFGKWHLGSALKDSPVNPGNSGFDEWVSAPNFFDSDPILSRGGTAVQFKGESSMVTVDVTLEFIKKHKEEDRPFFAVVWFGSPHNPFIAEEQDKILYSSEDENLQNYYGEITGMDRAFGKLRNSLRELGIAENTILWYNSDNGGRKELSVTGGRDGKGSVYEGGLRVPAIIEWPDRIKKPRTVQIPCNTYDIYPTILDILNISPPNQRPLDGISLVDVMDNEIEKRPKAMGFWDYSENGIIVPSKVWMSDLLQAQKEGKPWGEEIHLRGEAGIISKQYPLDTFPGHAAWLDWPWKLHRIENDGMVNFELYSLKDDPMEETDRSEQEKERALQMKKALEIWLRSVVNSLNGGDY